MVREIVCVQMSCFARNSGRWLAAARQNLSNPAPVYLYFFNHTLEVIELFVPDKGCCHGSELVFVFDIELGLWTAEEQALAQAFVKYEACSLWRACAFAMFWWCSCRYWTSFAATGVPSFQGLPTWPAFTLDNQVYGVLDTGALLTPVQNLKQTFCDFWDANPVPPRLIWGSL
jgi:carboxylesterase type B